MPPFRKALVKSGITDSDMVSCSDFATTFFAADLEDGSADAPGGLVAAPLPLSFAGFVVALSLAGFVVALSATLLVDEGT